MNNTEKLLRAFIEAQGYEVERRVNHVRGFIVGCHGRKQDKEYDFLGGDEYQEINRVSDYKVTKKSKSENTFKISKNDVETINGCTHHVGDTVMLSCSLMFFVVDVCDDEYELKRHNQ